MTKGFLQAMKLTCLAARHALPAYMCCKVLGRLNHCIVIEIVASLNLTIGLTSSIHSILTYVSVCELQKPKLGTRVYVKIGLNRDLLNAQQFQEDEVRKSTEDLSCDISPRWRGVLELL